MFCIDALMGQGQIVSLGPSTAEVGHKPCCCHVALSVLHVCCVLLLCSILQTYHRVLSSGNPFCIKQIFKLCESVCIAFARMHCYHQKLASKPLSNTNKLMQHCAIENKHQVYCHAGWWLLLLQEGASRLQRLNCHLRQPTKIPGTCCCICCSCLNFTVGPLEQSRFKGQNGYKPSLGFDFYP